MTSNRYETIKIKNAVVLKYDCGYTKVECNSKTGRTIIRNVTGDRWIPEQIDRIFGLGEYKKLSEHIISYAKERNSGNPHAIEICIVAEYLPKQVRKDIKTEMPDDKNHLIGKYFK
jgi:hypothetical protein